MEKEKNLTAVYITKTGWKIIKKIFFYENLIVVILWAN
jgi:hypothetical protein